MEEQIQVIQQFTLGHSPVAMLRMLRTAYVEPITLKKQAVGPLDVLQQNPEVITVENNLLDQMGPTIQKARTAHVLLKRWLIHSVHA